MRIVFDGRAILNQLDGTGRYSLNIISEVIALLPDASFTILVRRDLNRETRELLPPTARLHEVSFKHVSPRTVFELGSLVDQLKPDLFHSPFMLQPVLMRTPGIVTVHDAMWWRHPRLQAHDDRARIAVGWLYYRVLVRLCVARAQRVVVVSEASRKDVVECWPGTAHKITVVHEGVDRCFKPFSDPDSTAAVLRELGVERFGYVLHVTNGRPYKNTTALLQAFAAIAPQTAHRMVVVGGLGRFYPRVMEVIRSLGIQQKTLVLGSVTNRQVVALMQSAVCLAFPSLFEGFGLPVVEAMACGCPVLTSDKGSLGEVAGDAALVIDPTSVPSIAEGLLALALDGQMRERLSTLGLRRARQFSWPKAAQSIVDIYRELLK